MKNKKLPHTYKFSNKYPRKGFLALLALLFFIVAPHVIYPIFLAKFLCFALFAISFNILYGFTGLLSFGHSLFFGVGAYVVAHSLKEIFPLQPAPVTALLLALMIGLVLGYLLGFLSIQKQGIYFSMITLAFTQMIYFLALKLPLTHGEDGIQGVPRGSAWGIWELNSNLSIYYFALILCALCAWGLYALLHSRFGLSLRAIKDNELRMESLGYDTKIYKTLAFVVAATVAAFAGGLKALVVQLASLTDVHWHASGEVVLMALMGGTQNFWGPALGALLLLGMQNYLSEWGSWLLIIQGLLFMACVIFFDAGITGIRLKKSV